jgi:hypothetical protein
MRIERHPIAAAVLDQIPQDMRVSTATYHDTVARVADDRVVLNDATGCADRDTSGVALYDVVLNGCGRSRNDAGPVAGDAVSLNQAAGVPLLIK